MIHNVKIIVLVFYLLIITAIVLLNWLYAGRALKANKEIGLYTPKYLQVFVKISSGIALFTALLIIFLLFIQIY